MRKVVSMLLIVMMLGMCLTGCGKNEFDNTGAINVISREEGSGTRGAFTELFGIEVKNENGEKVDMTASSADITNSTSVMMTSVEQNPQAIGYISLGSLNNTVKALKVDGAEASIDNIKRGVYKVSRPFNIATKAEISEVVQDFINFIMSKEGQAVVEDNGYISAAKGESFVSNKANGKVVVAGSSSVTPIMEKLIEAYANINPNAEIELQQSDSTTGINHVIEGICDIGMASRDLKDSELSNGLVNKVIALDGIAIIVNNENTVEDISSKEVMKIYTGEITTWKDIIK